MLFYYLIVYELALYIDVIAKGLGFRCENILTSALTQSSNDKQLVIYATYHAKTLITSIIPKTLTAFNL